MAVTRWDDFSQCSLKKTKKFNGDVTLTEVFILDIFVKSWTLLIFATVGSNLEGLRTGSGGVLGKNQWFHRESARIIHSKPKSVDLNHHNEQNPVSSASLSA